VTNLHDRGVISRYRTYLPVTDAKPVVSLNEGSTPLIYSPKLSLLVGRGADESGDVGAGLLKGVGGLFHQLVRAAVDRTVGGEQELPLGVEHRQRLLRGGPGVQVRQTAAPAHHPVQDREIGPDPLQIKTGGANLFHRGGHDESPRRRPARG